MEAVGGPQPEPGQQWEYFEAFRARFPKNRERFESFGAG